METFFSYARIEGFPTQFNEHKTAVTVDVLEAGLVLAFVILVFTAYLVIPGTQGKLRGYLFVRITVSIFIGAVVMIGNFGQEWEVGSIHTTTPYKAGSPHEIEADISVKLGLRSVNITLKQTDIKENDALKGEMIDYNERFTWAWDQGRFGFGPYAGRLQQEFRQAQRQGLPLPILWVADYFTWDGEGLRFGRYYRTAGWYAHILLWTAFPCWLLANFLYLSIVRYGAYFTVLTGLLQMFACLLWVVIRNPEELSIPFEKSELKTKYGVSFWLTLLSGTLCTVLGIIIIILDLRFPDEIAVFFGTDPLADYEEYHLTATELEIVRQKGKHRHEFDMVEMNADNLTTDGEKQQNTRVVLKRRTTVHRAQKSLFRTPVVTESYDEELPIYLNVPRKRMPVVTETYDEELPVYLNVPREGHSSPTYSSRERLNN